MKRFFALLLSLILLVGAFVGCTADPVDTQTDTSANASTDTEANESTSTQIKYEKPQDVLEASTHLVGLTDQKNSRLIVCDLAVEDWSNDAAVVWEFKDPRVNSAGIKFRYSEVFGGHVVLFCGGKGAGIISYETKKMLFYTTNVGNNPHSVELLPDGTFLVASSTGNEIHVYTAATGRTRPVQRIVCANAHGVLWDPTYQVVWAVGLNKLSAYTVSGGPENPRLTLNGGMVYTTSKSGLHDLSPCYGDPTKLFVTCEAGVLLFDKEEEKFSTAYPGAYYASKMSYVPGVGNYPDNVMAMTHVIAGQTVGQEWQMNQVTILVPLDKYTVRKVIRVAPNDAYYKLRVWIPDYQ
ncbi:MAG: hypothetical protein IIX85_09005 [Clostridia bacterium]|nr:hypothetical protein [Clostridia bacterium]MBQ5820618.1 hypothetical protein [Clostridia bacterium]